MISQRGKRLGDDLGDLGLDADRAIGRRQGRFGVPEGVDLEALEDDIHRVAGPVAEIAGGKVPPAVPVQPLGMIGPIRGGAEPDIPREGLRDGFFALRERPGAGAAAGVPDMDLANGPQRAGPEDLDGPAERLGGGALVAHLGGDLALCGQLPQRAALAEVVGQRLFAEDVLAGPHRGRGDDGVGVVGHGGDDGVDLLIHLIEHLAVVAETAGVGDLLCSALGTAVVDIAQGHDIGHVGHGIDEPEPRPDKPTSATLTLSLAA